MTRLRVRFGPFRPWVPLTSGLRPESYPVFHRVWTDGRVWMEWPTDSEQIEPHELRRLREVFG